MHAAGCLKQSPEERYGRFGDGFKRAGALDTPAAALAGAAADKRQPAAGGGRRGPEAQPKGRRAPVPRQYCFAYARLPRVSASSIWHKRHKRRRFHYAYDRLFMKKTGPHRAALIKQHKIVFGKRRSFGYAVSPFCRSISKDAGSIPTRS